MGTNGGLLDDLWEYNPQNDHWSVRASYGGSSRKGGVAFTLNGKGYVGTGKGYSGKKQSFQEYSPMAILGSEEMENQLSFFPNPVQNKLNIQASETVDKIRLISLSGQEYGTYKNQKEIDCSFLPTGVYFIQAFDQSGQQLSTKQLIKL